MATIDKNLGTVTAYKYAKNAGYEGTEEEFAQGLKNSAEYADNAQASATAAAGSATAAAGSASSAASANTAAQQAKTDAETAKTDAEAARDRAETAAQTLVLDSTLTSPTQAAQAAAVGSRIDEVVQILKNNDVAVSLTDGLTWIKNTLIRAATGAAAESTSFDATDYIDISSVEKLLYLRMTSTASSTQTGVAFYDAEKAYVFGVKNRPNASASGFEWYTVEIPDNIQFVRFCWWSAAAQEANNFSQEFLAYNAEMPEIGDRIDTLEDVLLPKSLIDVQPTDSGSINSTNGTVTSTTAYVHTDYIDLTGISAIRYARPAITGTSASGGMAFYDAEKTYISGLANLIGNRERGYIWQTLSVPDGAVYARFSWWSESSMQTYGLTGAFVVYDADKFAASVEGETKVLSTQIRLGAVNNPLGLHTMPDNEGALNVIKRCRQFTEFRWIPAVDLPRCEMDTLTPPDTTDNQFYEGVFKAGVEYKGLPYGNSQLFFPSSRYGRTDTFIGFGAPFSAFATAARNANSIIGKESGYRTNPVRSLPFAAVCSSLACYALNISPYVMTENIPDIEGMTAIGKIVNNGARLSLENLRLADIVNERSHHVSVITDIIRDQSGAIQYIEISEETTVGNGNRSVPGGQYGGLARRIAFTVEEFYWRYANYTLYRYAGIEAVPYEKSPYVDIGDEIPMNPILDLPVMPYEGEGFRYRVGNIPAASGLLISSDYYSHVRIFKDGAEIAASPYAIPADTTLVTFSTLGVADAGEYSAYLCNMNGTTNTDVTSRCHWTVFTA